MRFGVALASCVVALAAGGCGSAAQGSAPPRLIGFDTYYVRSGDFEGTRLVRLDSVTLRELPGRGLRLGDAATSSALSPDRGTLAIGGTNFGEILLVDSRRLMRTGTIHVVRDTTAKTSRSTSSGGRASTGWSLWSPSHGASISFVRGSSSWIRCDAAWSVLSCSTAARSRGSRPLPAGASCSRPHRFVSSSSRATAGATSSSWGGSA